MAEAEVPKETKEVKLEFIKCPICLEDMKEPKLLPCIHTFCKSCLENYIRKEQEALENECKLSAFPCPLCRQDIFPVDSTTAIDLWASDFPSNTLVVAVERQKKMKTCEKWCNPCHVKLKKDTKAELWCKNCNLFFCSDCKNLHDLFQSDHCICTVDHFQRDAFIKLRYRTLCERHGQKVSVVCRTHESITCDKCIALDHKYCANFIPVQEYFQQMKQTKSLESLIHKYNLAIEDMEVLTNTEQSHFDDLEHDKESAEEEMREKMEEAQNTLARIYENFLENLSKTCKEEKEKNKTKICKQQKLAIENSKAFLQATLQYGSDEAIVSIHCKGLKEFQTFQKNIQTYYRNKSFNNRLSASLCSEMKNLNKITSMADVKKTPCVYDQELPWSIDRWTYNPKIKKLLSFDGKLNDDQNDCYFTGLLFIQKSRIVAADSVNQKLKLFSNTGEALSHVAFQHTIWDVCETESWCLAVSGCESKTIIVVSVQDDRFATKQIIEVNCEPYGITSQDQSFLVSTYQNIHCYSSEGVLLYTIPSTKDIMHLLKLPVSNDVVASKDNTQVGDSLLQLYINTKSNSKQTILHCQTTSKYLGTRRQYLKEFLVDGSYQGACGMAADHQDNIYVCLKTNHHIVMVTRNSKSKTLLSRSDDINMPCSIAVQKSELVLAEKNRNFLKVFKQY